MSDQLLTMTRLGLQHGRIGVDAFHHACVKLKELIRDRCSKAIADGSAKPQALVIYEAVEALPRDTKKFDALAPELSAPLLKFIDQVEINYLADDTCKLIEEKFPHLKKSTASDP